MANRILLSLCFITTLLLIQGANATIFTFKNTCPYPVYPGILTDAGVPPLQTTGFKLESGAKFVVTAPPKWSGRMWARQLCSTDSTGQFVCASGDCGSGQLECNNAGAIPPATLVEFTLNGANNEDFYDISNVDGFNIPISIVASGGSTNCTSPTCAANLLSGCPQELWSQAADGTVVGCKSACLAFNTDQYCCRGAYGTPQVCKPSSYSLYFKKACPQAYSYAYDDGTSTFTCVGADYAIVFCPGNPLVPLPN
ncbi:hypothetical protein LUZ60_016228 [Juncus effusus]|nr:hypothetical protein LUZ60_016228 [Juncus effusus]